MTKAAVKKACGAIENNNVYFGEDNHLIKQELDYDKTTIQNNISYIQQFTENNNIKANILLIPDACYGEEQLLPKGAVNMDEKEMIQSIQQDLQDQTIIDITDTIHDTKNTYYKTDHHWNENGALLGYEAICKDVLNNITDHLIQKSSEISLVSAFWYSKIVLPDIHFNCEVKVYV